jgi:hypothetical protein
VQSEVYGIEALVSLPSSVLGIVLVGMVVKRYEQETWPRPEISSVALLMEIQ